MLSLKFDILNKCKQVVQRVCLHVYIFVVYDLENLSVVGYRTSPLLGHAY